jgi:protoporphyrinogen/coproporphyrinogen III oxidase
MAVAGRHVEAGSRDGSGRVAVVGGGASGIAAAHFLRRRGLAVDVFERSPWIGGRCESQRLGERSVTLGGKNIGRRYRRFREFVAGQGSYDYEEFGINSSQVRDGRVQTIDSGHRLRSALNFARGFPPRDLGRFAYLVARVRSNPENRFLGSSYFEAVGRRRDSEPLAAHFGEELNTVVLRPMTVRMNGAEPDEAYLGNFGSNLGMLLDTYDQIEQGLGNVLETFAADGGVNLGTAVQRLLVQDGRVRGIEVEGAGGERQELSYDAVVVATTAESAAELLRPLDARLAERLEEVRYFPAAVVIAEYDRDVFPPDTRAFVFDRSEPLSNAGAYGISALNVVRYTFSGRAARPILAGDPGPDELLDIGEKLLAPLTAVGEAERGPVVHRRWERAYCAYLPYHGAFRREVTDRMAKLPGLALAGDYLRGASLEACFHAAEDAAGTLAESLTRSG